MNLLIKPRVGSALNLHIDQDFIHMIENDFHLSETFFFVVVQSRIVGKSSALENNRGHQ